MIKKNFLVMLLISMSATTSFAQSDFVLNGKIKGWESGYIKLIYFNDNKPVQDSIAINNGSFSFKGKVTEPSIAYIVGPGANMVPTDPNFGMVFIESGNLQAELVYGDFKNIVILGSRTNDEYQLLEKRKKETSREEAEKIYLDYAKENPDSYITAYWLSSAIRSLPLSLGEQLYNGLSSRIKASKYGRDIAAAIKKLQGGSAGQLAANFSVIDINGVELKLSDYREKKYVLLDFWASWCVPCRKGNPHLLSLYSKYKDKGLEIIGVASDDGNENAWKNAIAQDKIGVWRHVLRGYKRNLENNGKHIDISNAYAISTLPTKILIDKSGVIIGRYGGGGDNDAAMDKKLEEIFE